MPRLSWIPLIDWVLNFPIKLYTLLVIQKKEKKILMTLTFFFRYIECKRAESLKNESLKSVLKLMAKVFQMDKSFALLLSWIVDLTMRFRP